MARNLNVSFIDTLHPDQGPLHVPGENQHDGGSWNTVWVEAVAIDVEAEGSHQARRPEHEGTNETESPNDGGGHGRKNRLLRFNFLALIIGGSVVLCSVVAAFGMEVGAAVVFVIAAGFRFSSDTLQKVVTNQPPLAASLISPFTLLIQSIFGLVASILLVVDSILLLTSTMVTEILAAVAGMVCTLFGGVAVGQEYHQLVRRLCHLTRWQFRKFHSDWSSPRGSMISATHARMNNNTDNANQYQDVPISQPDENRREAGRYTSREQRNNSSISTTTAARQQSDEVIVLGVEQHTELVQDDIRGKPEVLTVTQV